MTDLFAHTHARASDPATSHAAAASASLIAPTQCERILACLKRYGPASKDEIAAKTGLTGVQVDRRLPDLKAQGKALPSPVISKSASGRDERCWVAT
jgi:predicted ArsR family transcriptional regulator